MNKFTQKVNLTKCLCLDDDEYQKTIVGQFISDKFYYIQILINECVNSSNCATEAKKQIYRDQSGPLIISYYFKNSIIDTSQN